MEFPELLVNLCVGWCFWSLAHNLGHRWWHREMRHGKQTFYAHGEREHHRLYDRPDADTLASEDPRELFISFPLPQVAAAALAPVLAYGWLRTWPDALPFAAALYASMVLDDYLHRRFHRERNLPGVLGRLQHMHRVHHVTHDRNYFFLTGLLWDVLFRTAVLTANDASSPGR